MVKGHDAIAFDDLFSTGQSATDASAYIVAPLTYLLSNDFEKVEVSGLDLTIVSTEERKTATLERVWNRRSASARRPHGSAQDSPPDLSRRETRCARCPFQIPANASGTLSITVTNGSRLNQMELRQARTAQRLRSVDSVIKSLNRARRNNTVYVKLLGTDAGAVVNGEVLSSLPPSVLAVLEADRNGGTFNPVRSATIGEWEIATRTRHHWHAHALAHGFAQLINGS